jgi:hypothetical protein
MFNLRPHPASLGYRLRSATLPTRGRETGGTAFAHMNV